jgi:hypothetical protein
MPSDLTNAARRVVRLYETSDDIRDLWDAIGDLKKAVGPDAGLKAGDPVRLAKPADDAEAAAIYDVEELRGERVLIALRCDLPIRPTECVLVSDVERVGEAEADTASGIESLHIPLVLNPLPESHHESSECPPAPETDLPHGTVGPRLVIRDVGGFSSSTRTGNWRWCADCREWKKAVAIIGAMLCPTCHREWSR